MKKLIAIKRIMTRIAFYTKRIGRKSKGKIKRTRGKKIKKQMILKEVVVKLMLERLKEHRKKLMIVSKKVGS